MAHILSDPVLTVKHIQGTKALLIWKPKTIK